MILKILEIKKNSKPRLYLVKCNKCGKEFKALANNLEKRSSFIKYKQHLCASCALKLDYETGKRISKIGEYATKFQKGKTFDEIYGVEKSADIRKRISEKTSGKNNAMYGDYEHTKGWRRTAEKIRGKHLEDVYGEEKGKQMRKKISENLSGKKNPMYGKPSPLGSGNGWSGWYNGFYFRSLLELSFLISKNSLINLKSAEYIKIPYIDWKNSNRNYIPDFIEENVLIEIKPYRLLSSKDNLAKFEAARIFCLKNKLIFKVLTEKDIEIDFEKIKNLYKNSKVKFIKRYEEKMEKYLNA